MNFDIPSEKTLIYKYIKKLSTLNPTEDHQKRLKEQFKITRLNSTKDHQRTLKGSQEQ